MGNFFNNLIDRTLGSAPTVEPFAPPLFAPAPGEQTPLDGPLSTMQRPIVQRAVNEPVTEQAGQERDDAPLLVPPTADRATPAHPEQAHRQPFVQLDDPFADAAPIQAPGDRAARGETFDHLDRAALQRGPHRITTDRPVPAPFAAPPTSSQRDRVPRVREAAPLLVEADVAPSLGQPQHNQLEHRAAQRREPSSQETAAPTIHVSIGRIDVRAVNPPTPAAPQRKSASSSTMSLDEYLRTRNGGRA